MYGFRGFPGFAFGYFLVFLEIAVVGFQCDFGRISVDCVVLLGFVVLVLVERLGRIAFGYDFVLLRVWV